MKSSCKHLTLFLCTCLAMLMLAACSSMAQEGNAPDAESMPAVTQKPDTPTPVPPPTMTPTPEPSPTPTLPPPPVAVLVPRLYTIEIAQGSKAPADLQEFVFNYPSSAGGGTFCAEGGTPMWVTSFAGAAVPAVPGRISWEMENMSVTPEAQAILTAPDGSQTTLEARVWGGCGSISFEILPGTMLGSYTLELVQGSISIMDTFSLQLPTDPVRVVYEGYEWFAGFEPNERVTLWLYYLGTLQEFMQPELAPLFPGFPDLSSRFGIYELENFTINALLGQQIVLADEYGSFQVTYTSEQIPLTDESYRLDIGEGSRITTVAQGEVSGFTADNRLTGSCYDSLPTRLDIGDTAWVTDYAAGNDQFTVDSSTIMDPGTVVTMVAGPFCITGYGGLVRDRWLWFIDAPGYISLLVSECSSEGYFLEPLEP